MKKIILLTIAFIVINNCGESGSDTNFSENCNFSINSITNGPNNDEMESYWKCATEGPFGAFAIFDNYTGSSIVFFENEISYSGFTWEETDCNEITYSGVNLLTNTAFTGTAQNFNGSTASGTLTFKVEEEGDSIVLNCALKEL